jgi:hypothetical protein
MQIAEQAERNPEIAGDRRKAAPASSRRWLGRRLKTARNFTANGSDGVDRKVYARY